MTSWETGNDATAATASNGIYEYHVPVMPRNEHWRSLTTLHSGPPTKSNLPLGDFDQVIRRPSHVFHEIVRVRDKVADVIERGKLAHEMAIEAERCFSVDRLV